MKRLHPLALLALHILTSRILLHNPVTIICILSLTATDVQALPHPDTAGKPDDSVYLNTSLDFESLGQFESSKGKRQSRKSVDLRILPLGASIVWGVGSGTGNGFRKPLRDHLKFKGWTVNMVGSKQNGDMVDNNVEATPGDIITQIHDRSRLSYGYKPNIILINGGTNDANRNIDIADAGGRMESLINDLWAAPDMQDTLVVLSTILPTTAGGETNRLLINMQYKELVARRREEGKHIVLADMDYLITVNDLVSDGVHPNDGGHLKMANTFWIAIEQAHSVGFITNPAPMDVASSATCEKTYGSGTYAGGLTQRGSGTGDGIYYHDSVEKGIALSVESDWDRDQWFFAK